VHETTTQRAPTQHAGRRAPEAAASDQPPTAAAAAAEPAPLASPSSRRFLFLVHRVPYPPNRGDRIRSFRILEFLARHGEVDLAYLTDEPPGDETAEVLGRLCRRVLPARL
jgi:hypothetical protein